MPNAALFLVSLLARGIAILALTYSDWLLHLLREGCQVGCESLIDGWEFLNFLRGSITHQIFGHQSNY